MGGVGWDREGRGVGVGGVNVVSYLTWIIVAIESTGASLFSKTK